MSNCWMAKVKRDESSPEYLIVSGSLFFLLHLCFRVRTSDFFFLKINLLFAKD